MKYFLNVIGFIIVVIISLLVGFLLTHVILDVAGLYQLSFITCYSFAQVYCVIGIIGLIPSKSKDKEDDKISFGENLIKIFGTVIGKCIGILFSWGFLYLLHGFLI